MPKGFSDLPEEERVEGSDPAKIVEDNFSLDKVLDELLSDVEEKVRTKAITIETMHELRKIYRTYLSGNTAVSFTTDKFIQVTVGELAKNLWIILAKDYYMGKDLNRVQIEVRTVLDTIALALKRALGGKERTLILSGFRIFLGSPYPYEEENQKRRIM